MINFTNALVEASFDETFPHQLNLRSNSRRSRGDQHLEGQGGPARTATIRIERLTYILRICLVKIFDENANLWEIRVLVILWYQYLIYVLLYQDLWLCNSKSLNHSLNSIFTLGLIFIHISYSVLFMVFSSRYQQRIKVGLLVCSRNCWVIFIHTCYRLTLYFVIYEDESGSESAFSFSRPL